MIKNNFSASEVDEAISQVSSSSTASSNSNSMQSNQMNSANQYPVHNNAILESQIRNYISTQMRSGYTIDVIKNALLRNGFDSNAVYNVAREFGAGNSGNDNINIKHEVHVSKGTIIGLMLIMLIGVGVYGFFNFNPFNTSDSKSLLDVSVTTTAYSYVSGDNVNYQMHITNMGSQNRFDTIVKTIIMDDSGTIITRKEETVAVETSASINRNIQLPQNTPSGKYSLKIITDYGGNQATSSAEFEVVKSVIDKKPSDYVPNPSTGGTNTNTGSNSNTNNGGTKPSTNNNGGSNTNTNTGTTSSTDTTTFGELLSDIRSTAKNNPSLASSKCSKLTSVEQKDVCYQTISDVTELTSYCSNIVDPNRKDNCYLSFVIKGNNADVCNNIKDSSSKQFCEQLKIVQLMDKYYRENNTEKIIELSKEFNPSIYNSNPTIPSYEYTYTETATISIVDIANAPGAEIVANTTSNSTGNSTHS